MLSLVEHEKSFINLGSCQLQRLEHVNVASTLSKNETAHAFLPIFGTLHKIGKRAKIRNRYNQAPHLTQDTSGKVTTSLLDIAIESPEVSPLTAGEHKASINRRAQKHNKYKTEIT